MAMLIVALPLGIFRWLRDADGTVTIGRAVVGKPFAIRARLLSLKSVQLEQQACIFVYAPPGHPLCKMRITDNPPVSGGINDWHRSALVFVEAEAEVTLPLPGRYEFMIKYPLARRRIYGEFVVEASEPG
ncbi:MAG TPA: hypothetical protein VFI31_15645 [Pirellulales bacterium]|nr:hypothetical protein [Pirellulales bacterium]